jgi:hypothetical protein
MNMTVITPAHSTDIRRAALVAQGANTSETISVAPIIKATPADWNQ